MARDLSLADRRRLPAGKLATGSSFFAIVVVVIIGLCCCRCCDCKFVQVSASSLIETDVGRAASALVNEADDDDDEARDSSQVHLVAANVNYQNKPQLTLQSSQHLNAPRSANISAVQLQRNIHHHQQQQTTPTPTATATITTTTTQLPDYL